MTGDDDDVGDPGDGQGVDDTFEQRAAVDIRKQLVVLAEATRGAGGEQHCGDAAFSRHCASL